MKILILAAGYGTRLKEIAQDTPKALLDVGSKSIANHILDRIVNLNGLNEVIVVTNDKFCPHFEKWALEMKGFQHKITVVNDGTKSNDDRLGSIGDINFVIQQCALEDDVLVVGGDNLFSFNVEEYVLFAQEKPSAISIGLYDIGKKEDATEFGVVGIDENSKVVSFEEKPEHPQSSLISMCFYYLPKNTLGFVGDYLVESGKSDKAGDYIKWLYQRHEVYGFTFSGKWFDIGSVESYHQAQSEFK